MSKLQVNDIVDKDDVSAPGFSKGANITGLCTATTFVGNLTGNVTGNASGVSAGADISPNDLNITGVATFSNSANFSSGVTVTGNVIATSKFRGNDDVKLSLGDSEDLQIYHNGSTNFIVDTAGDLRIRGDAVKIQSGDGHNCAQFLNDSSVDLYYNNSKKFETTNDGTVTTGIATATSFSDSDGTLRSLPVNSQTSAYSLVAADAGKLIKITTGGVTCPNGESFAAGDMISIMNESGSAQTITQGGGATLYWTADGSTGNRTLGARGVATIVMAGTAAFYISGSGLS